MTPVSTLVLWIINTVIVIMSIFSYVKEDIRIQNSWFREIYINPPLSHEIWKCASRLMSTRKIQWLLLTKRQKRWICSVQNELLLQVNIEYEKTSIYEFDYPHLENLCAFRKKIGEAIDISFISLYLYILLCFCLWYI